jgi:predicted permease
VIVQVAVSLVLLSAAAMLGQSLRNLEHQNFGFDTSGRYLVTINPLLSNYKPKELLPLFREIGERLRAILGVRMVSPALYAPMTGSHWDHDLRMEGKPEPGPKEDVSSAWTRVTAGFFETLGDRIVMGRTITDDDNTNTRPVAVINEAFRKRFFGKESPIGQHFGPAPRKNAGMYEIVGVASDMRYFPSSVWEPETPMYFLPEAQTTHFDEADSEGREIWSHYLYNIVIWAPGNPPDMQAQVKKALTDVDPNLVIYGVRPYSAVIHGDFAQQNMIASLTWLFGAVGLVLAAVGIYGVTAYGVDQRTREIGVRMALGAQRSSVYQLILKEAGWLTLIGVVIGLSGSIAAGMFMRSLLFGVRSWDVSILGTVATVLITSALLASYIPARRATRVDPMVALRYE